MENVIIQDKYTRCSNDKSSINTVNVLNLEVLQIIILLFVMRWILVFIAIVCLNSKVFGYGILMLMTLLICTVVLKMITS